MNDQTLETDTWPPRPEVPETETINAARNRLVEGYKSQLLATSRIAVIAWCVLAMKLIFLPMPTGYTSFAYIGSMKPIVSVAYFAVLCALGVLYLKWVFDTAKNADVLTGNPSTTSPTVSVIAYFVPVLSLYVPYSNMKAAWDRVAAGVSLEEYKAGSIIGWWWAAWITNALVRLGVNLPLIDAPDTAVLTIMSFIDYLIYGALTVVSIRMMSVVSTMQQRVYEAKTTPRQASA